MAGISNIFLETPLVSHEEIDISPFVKTTVSLVLAREDQIHPTISGNKFRKLRHNLLSARAQGATCLLTYGGAFSNHIAAVAATARSMDLKSIGIIRGEELANQVDSNPTLRYAKSCGMELHFISRREYREKEKTDFREKLQQRFGEFYELPEGGTNALAVKGSAEILATVNPANVQYICAPVGTGGTLAGLVAASSPGQRVLGFSALKGTFQEKTVVQYTDKNNFEITDAYNFGGYAKIDAQLIRFMNRFRNHTGILLDPVYTAKMLYGIIDLLKNGYFRENSRIFAVHTGGLQGIAGMNRLLDKKKLPQIEK
ncbi:MAG: 1-aminocyclopropane-1-carboxylate deaminase [Flavobacteriaceae bacterium]|nr:1-aminocyclopropane-1-carboxylate deaminase [Flavobacteriaceae bacterium]